MAPAEGNNDLLTSYSRKSGIPRIQGQHGKFHSKLKKQGLKTFANITVERKIQEFVGYCSQGGQKHIQSHDLGHVIESRQMNMKDVLVHPLSLVPWWCDAKENKQGKECVSRRSDPNPMCYHRWRDGLGPEAEWKEQDFRTKGTMQENWYSLSRTDILLIDVYRSTFIKQAERVNRSADNSLQYNNLVGGHHVQQ